MSTIHLLRTLEPDYKVVLVGDARMAQWELTDRYGAIAQRDLNATPGLLWLRWVAEHFHHCVWLNPVRAHYWNHTTVSLIRRIFPMFELTLDGLGETVKRLVVSR